MIELKAYEIKDGAYGMYLAEDGFSVDVDFEFVYPKEQADKVIADKDKEIAELKKRLDTTEKLLNKALNGIAEKFKEKN